MKVRNVSGWNWDLVEQTILDSNLNAGFKRKEGEVFLVLYADDEVGKLNGGW